MKPKKSKFEILKEFGRPKTSTDNNPEILNKKIFRVKRNSY